MAKHLAGRHLEEEGLYLAPGLRQSAVHHGREGFGGHVRSFYLASVIRKQRVAREWD